MATEKEKICKKFQTPELAHAVDNMFAYVRWQNCQCGTDYHRGEICPRCKVITDYFKAIERIHTGETIL